MLYNYKAIHIPVIILSPFTVPSARKFLQLEILEMKSHTVFARESELIHMKVQYLNMRNNSGKLQ